MTENAKEVREISRAHRMNTIRWSVTGVLIAFSLLLLVTTLVGTIRQLQTEVALLRAQVGQLEEQVRDLGGDPITRREDDAASAEPDRAPLLEAEPDRSGDLDTNTLPRGQLGDPPNPHPPDESTTESDTEPPPDDDGGGSPSPEPTDPPLPSEPPPTDLPGHLHRDPLRGLPRFARSRDRPPTDAGRRCVCSSAWASSCTRSR